MFIYAKCFACFPKIFLFILVLKNVDCKQTISTWNNNIVCEVSIDLLFEVKCHKLQKHGLMIIVKNFWFAWATIS